MKKLILAMLVIFASAPALARHHHRQSMAEIQKVVDQLSCATKAEAQRRWPGERLYSHTTAHCWDNSSVLNHAYNYQRTAANIDVAPEKPEKQQQPTITILKVEINRERFTPWDERIEGITWPK